jgi:hypothetical protein
MLWRTPYEPRIIPSAELPVEPGIGSVYVGAFDLRAVGEMGVWTRLFEDADLDYRILLVQKQWSPQSRALAKKVFRPSQGDLLIFSEQWEAWNLVVQPDRAERSFGVNGQLLVVGPPTEEVWDLFRSGDRP